MLKKIYTLVSVIVFIIPCILAVFFPAVISALASEALKLCINSIVPSLFPFMVMTQILSRTGLAHRAGACISCIVSPILGISRNLCGAVLVGAVGGFPNGAYAVGIAYKNGLCTKSEAERAIALCNNCSLVYICTIAGSVVLGNIKAGLVLLISQAVCVIFASIILRGLYKSTNNSIEIKQVFNKESISSILCRSITESGLNTLHMCSYIVFFYIISGLISLVSVKNAVVQTAIRGIFEMSGGVNLCTLIDFPLNYVICSAIIGFSGISVILQVSDVCEKYKLSAKEFILSRLFNIFFMPVVTTLLLMVLPAKTIYVNSTISHNQSYCQLFSLHPNILYSALIAIAVVYILRSKNEKKVFRQKQ